MAKRKNGRRESSAQPETPERSAQPDVAAEVAPLPDLIAAQLGAPAEPCAFGVRMHLCTLCRPTHCRYRTSHSCVCGCGAASGRPRMHVPQRLSTWCHCCGRTRRVLGAACGRLGGTCRAYLPSFGHHGRLRHSAGGGAAGEAPDGGVRHSPFTPPHIRRLHALTPCPCSRRSVLLAGCSRLRRRCPRWALRPSAAPRHRRSGRRSKCCCPSFPPSTGAYSARRQMPRCVSELRRQRACTAAGLYKVTGRGGGKSKAAPPAPGWLPAPQRLACHAGHGGRGGGGGCDNICSFQAPELKV